MSNLESVVQSQLQTRKQFTFLGSDGCIVQAHNYDGVLAVHVTDPLRVDIGMCNGICGRIR